MCQSGGLFNKGEQIFFHFLENYVYVVSHKSEGLLYISFELRFYSVSSLWFQR